METVLVTGAAGTVGNYVVSLAEAAGHRVIATDLSANGIAVPVRGEVRAGDLRDPEFVRRLVRGVDRVIHTAAMLDTGAPFEALHAVNTAAVATLYDAAKSAGAKRFVHVSSSLVYGLGSRGRLREDARVEARGPHGRTKLEAEALLRQRALSEGAMPITLLRPAPLYGRRGRHFAAILLVVGPALRLSTPVLPRPAGGPIHSFVHAEDVARVAIHVMQRPECENATYNVADDDPLPLGVRVTQTFEAYGLRSFPAGELPRSVLDKFGQAFHSPAAFQSLDTALLGAWKLVVAKHSLKPALRARVDREAISLLHDDLVLDTSQLKSTGWTPRYPTFAEGFRQVLRWYQAERWAPRYT